MPILVACPACSRQLRVTDDLVGQKVRCPACQVVFAAAKVPAPPAPAPASSTPSSASSGENDAWKGLNLELTDDKGADRSASPKGAVELKTPQDEEAPPPRTEPPARREEEEEREPAPRRGEWRSRSRFDDEEEERGRRRERPRRSEDEDEDERERAYPRRVRRDCEPHRGGLVLTLGILSLVGATLFMICFPGFLISGALGIVAWVLGHADLRKMKAGQMDPEGHGSTQAGWICGIIGTALSALLLLACGAYFAFVFAMMPGPTPPPTRPKFGAPPPPPPAFKAVEQPGAGA